MFATRLRTALLVALTAGCASVLLAKVTLSVANDSAVGHVSGALTACAIDLSQGTFYRPLYAEETGYGGTRFFPLYFVLQAALLRLTGMPIASGHAISVFAGLLLLAMTMLFLRQQGAGRWWSVLMVVVLLSAGQVQYGIASVRSDVLSTALNVAGLCVYSARLPVVHRRTLAALLFTLAFSAKVTAAQGVVSVCLWLVLTGDWKEASRLAGLVLLGYAAVVGTLYLTTQGRAIAVLTDCASGGATVRSLALSLPRFLMCMAQDDPVCLVLVCAAAGIALYPQTWARFPLPSVYFGVCLATTVLLYGSPGVMSNHLVDVATASVLLTGAWGPGTGAYHRERVAVACAMVVLLAASLGLQGLRDEWSALRSGGNTARAEAAAIVAATDGRVICEDPLLAIRAGRSPYVLDAFMLRIAAAKYSTIRDSLLDSLKTRQVRMVVFMRDPEVDHFWYDRLHFGRQFVDAVLKDYKRERACGGYYFYVPGG